MTPAEYRALKDRILDAVSHKENCLPSTIHPWNDPGTAAAMLLHAESAAIGPTGEAPIVDDPGDKGGTQASLTEEPGGTLRIDFGTSLSWLRMTKREAQNLALGILSKTGLPDGLGRA